MLPYFFLLAIPALLAIVAPYSKSHSSLAIVGILYVIFMGFRFHVGMDWNNYAIIHRTVGTLAWHDILQGAEPASYLLFRISNDWLSGHETTNVVAAATLTIGVFTLALRSDEPWLSIAVATPYLMYVIGMNAVRQAIAIGIVFLVLAAWDKSSGLVKTLGILFASLFHSSAFIFLLLWVWDLNIRFLVKLFAATIIASLAYFALQKSSLYAGAIDAYAANYLGPGGGIESPGAIAHVALIVAPALAYIFSTRGTHDHERPSLLTVGGYGSLALLPITLLQTTIASRLSLYFWFFPILFYPYFLGRHVSPSLRSAARIVLLLIHFLYMYIWFEYANNSYAWLPYRNSLFL